MAGGVTVSTLAQRKASDRTDSGQDNRYASPPPRAPRAARWRRAALWAPRVQGASQSQVPKSVSLQSGDMLSPIPTFMTQTYHPNPNLSYKKGERRWLLGLSWRELPYLCCSFPSFAPYIGNAILCFLKFSTSAGALDPLPHLLTRKVLLHYLVSFTFSLFFQDFFFLGLKLCSQSFSPSSPQTTTKKTHFWSWFWLFLLPFFFYLLPRPSKIESINSFSLLIFPFTSRPTNVRLLPQMTLGVSRRALVSDTVNFWAKSLLKIWRGRSKWMLSGWRNEHRKRASKGMTFTKWRVLIHARRGQVLQILVSLDNNGWLWTLIEFCS